MIVIPSVPEERAHRGDGDRPPDRAQDRRGVRWEREGLQRQGRLLGVNDE